MIQNTYVQDFNKYKKYKPSDSEISFLRSSLPTFSKKINQLFIKPNEEIPDFETVVAVLHKLCKEACSNRFIDSLLYETIAIDTLLDNPTLFDSIIPNIKNAKCMDTILTADQKRSQRLEVETAIAQVKEIETLPKVKINGVYKLRATLPENPTEEQKNDVKMYEAILNAPHLKEKIKIYLHSRKLKCESFIRREQIATMVSIGKILKTLGFADEYMETYNKTKNKLGFSELSYDISNPSLDKDICFLDTFSESYLKTLPIRNLCFLSCHWANRFAKECLSLSNYFTAIHSLDIWEKVSQGNFDFSDISDESLQAVLIKSNYFENLFRKTFSLHTSSLKKDQMQKGGNASVPLEKDYTSYYKKISNSINQDYSKFFASKNLRETSFHEDLCISAPFVNFSMFSYEIKDTLLEPLIQELLLSPHFKNWGIIRNELTNGNFVDSITTNRNNILMAFDIKGFNMPFRFHIGKDSLIDVTRLTNQNDLIPEYQGADDFYINNEPVPSNIIMPVPRHHLPIIQKNSKEDGPLKKFWEHKYFLINEKLPSHFTETIKKSKKNIITKRNPIVYTKLKTGERFILEKGEFKEFVENQK